MTRRVLIVASSYAPAMIADMQRARQLAWELPSRGWSVEILAPGEAYQHPSCVDADSAPFFAPDVPVHYADTIAGALFRGLGLRSIGWRALLPLLARGNALLRARRFDLVYISTTQFPLFLLGPTWRARFGVPFVLDLHDPCYQPRRPSWNRGGMRHALSRWLTKRIESLCVRRASGLVAVSPDYIATLVERYGRDSPAWSGRGRHEVIPFAAMDRDLRVALDAAPGADPRHPAHRIAYVGAGGPIMARSFSLLSSTLAVIAGRDPAVLGRYVFDLRGTMYGWMPGQPKPFEAAAEESGIAAAIREDPARVSYRKSLEIVAASDGLLILGVDDPAYMPSKLFNYALTGKPLLAVVRRESAAMAHLRTIGPGVHALWFEDGSEMPSDEAIREMQAFLEDVASGQRFERSASLAPFMSGEMAGRHGRLFETCVSP